MYGLIELQAAPVLILLKKSNIRLDDDCIILTHKLHPLMQYEIERNQLNTPEQILGWGEHLSRKNWVNKEILMDFLHIAFSLIKR